MKKEKGIKELVERVFEKAKKESQKDTAYGLCKYLSEEEKVHSSERNLTRYYNHFIDGKKEEKIKPDDATLDELSQYLGHTSFNAFIKDLEKKEHDIDLEGKIRVLKNYLTVAVILLVVLSLTFLFFASMYYRKNCMVWVEDHYEKIRCSGLENEVKLNEEVLLKMKEINDPLQCERDMWYDKTDNEVTFFTYYGEHPVNGKILRPVTEYICEKYILERRDSILANTASLDTIK
ncbi:hypothetical protein [Flagellimonas oceanensis]|uniref:hypothetical protein n=1 Tax=Flagellimonas oceanensis TaxID=2499163 RepID=UPI000F8D19BE|nr:hypothetical protein [Allomuricauda oceanensis]